MNLTGPYWIGAIRLCFRGQEQINMSNILRQLDICQFYFTFNEAIGKFTCLPIVFIKNINMTQAAFTTVSLSDEAHYTQFGKSSLTIIEMILDECPFFIKNIQLPIVRTGELIFHDLLFTSLCIELFAFAFLLIKLVIIPLLKWIGDLWKKYYTQNDKLVNSNLQSTGDYISKIEERIKQCLTNLSHLYSIKINQKKNKGNIQHLK